MRFWRGIGGIPVDHETDTLEEAFEVGDRLLREREAEEGSR